MNNTLRVGLWILEKIPALQVLIEYSPAHLHQRLLQFKNLARGLAKRIVDEARESLVDDKGKDMLSILGMSKSDDQRRNLSRSP